jgi:hypothetical protein
MMGDMTGTTTAGTSIFTTSCAWIVGRWMIPPFIYIDLSTT